MKTLIVLIALTSFNSFASDCLDHSNTPAQNAACAAVSIESALRTACADHTSSRREILECKEELRNECLDHESSLEEILSCISAE